MGGPGPAIVADGAHPQAQPHAATLQPKGFVAMLREIREMAHVHTGNGGVAPAAQSERFPSPAGSPGAGWRPAHTAPDTLALSPQRKPGGPCSSGPRIPPRQEAAPRGCRTGRRRTPAASGLLLMRLRGVANRGTCSWHACKGTRVSTNTILWNCPHARLLFRETWHG